MICHTPSQSALASQTQPVSGKQKVIEKEMVVKNSPLPIEFPLFSLALIQNVFPIFFSMKIVINICICWLKKKCSLLGRLFNKAWALHTKKIVVVKRYLVASKTSHFV